MTITSELQRALDEVLSGKKSRALESQRLEFKQHPAAKEDVRDLVGACICFANAEGGVVIVGVVDALAGPEAFSGTQLDVDEVKRQVWAGSVPSLLVDVEAVQYATARLLLIRVPESPDIHSDNRGLATRRVGTSCMPLTPAEQARAREERHGRDWTALPADTDVPIAANALEAARSGLARLQGPRRDLARLDAAKLLAALKLSSEGRLSRAGQILMGEASPDSPEVLIYQYRNTPGGEPTFVERFQQPVLPALLSALERINARSSMTPLNLRSGQQIELRDYPELAVREALVNALIHRDWQVRQPVHVEHSPELLVITSPGPLVAGVTMDNILTTQSRPRNPALSGAVRILGLAEEIGRGVDRMFRETIRSGLAPPRIEATSDYVRVSFSGGRPNTLIARFVAQLPEREREDTDTMLVLLKLCSHRTITSDGFAQALQRSAAETERVLRRLSEDAVGILEPTRQTFRRTFRTYRLRAAALKELGSAVPYQRRSIDEIDRKVISHVREWSTINNRTVQNLFDVGLQRARSILADLVSRRILVKVSEHERGPGVEYGPGPIFPPRDKSRRKRSGQLALSLPTPRRGRRRR